MAASLPFCLSLSLREGRKGGKFLFQEKEGLKEVAVQVNRREGERERERLKKQQEKGKRTTDELERGFI